MVQNKCRPRNFICFFIAFVIFLNIFIIFKLLKQECPKPISPIPRIVYQNCQMRKEDKNRNILQQQSIGQTDQYSKEDFSNLPRFDLNLGRWDNKLAFKLYDNILVGEQYTLLSQLFQTCLATHSSLERISSIIEVARHWNGPISLAVFAASEEELNKLLLYIAYLRKCDLNIRQKIAFHLTVDKNRLPKEFSIDWDELDKMNCADNELLRNIVDEMRKKSGKWRTKLAYPQNHLRNLARKNCQTKYVFLTDVDVIPSQGMAEDLDEFLLSTNCVGKCAYVIPTYELDERIQFPANKTELIRLAKKKLARPFHEKVFIFNQYATNFSRWESTTKEEKKVHISHLVTNFEFLYEPFYVAVDEVPPHDERFVGYGYTRNSQVYEMFVAGYNFYVLSPIFTCHWQLQGRRSRPFWREMQNNANRKIFESFKREIFAKYARDPLNMMKALKKN